MEYDLDLDFSDYPIKDFEIFDEFLENKLLKDTIYKESTERLKSLGLNEKDYLSFRNKFHEEFLKTHELEIKARLEKEGYFYTKEGLDKFLENRPAFRHLVEVMDKDDKNLKFYQHNLGDINHPPFSELSNEKKIDIVLKAEKLYKNYCEIRYKKSNEGKSQLVEETKKPHLSRVIRWTIFIITFILGANDCSGNYDSGYGGVVILFSLIWGIINLLYDFVTSARICEEKEGREKEKNVPPPSYLVGQYLLLPAGYCLDCYNPEIIDHINNGILREITMGVRDKNGNFVKADARTAVLFNKMAKDNGTYDKERYELDSDGSYVLQRSEICRAFDTGPVYKCLKCGREHGHFSSSREAAEKKKFIVQEARK